MAFFINLLAFDCIYLLTNRYLHAILFWCAASLGNPNRVCNLAAICNLDAV